jgi:hypothetical protein
MITRILGATFLALALGSVTFSQALPKPVEQAPAPRAVVRDFDEALHKNVIYPAVRVVNTKRPQFGTGVVIRSEAVPSNKKANQYVNVMLTCAHCVIPGQNYTADLAVYEADGTKFIEWEQNPLVVYHYSYKYDIAICVFVTNHPVHVATMDFETRLSMGNEILHVGCGAGEDPRFDKGQITGLKGRVRPHPNDVYRTNMMTVFGDSGGPAYYKNKLIGLMQAIKITRFQGEPFPVTGISFCIPIGTVKVLDNEQNNTLSFVYNSKSEVPKLPVVQLKYEPIDWEEITQGE